MSLKSKIQIIQSDNQNEHLYPQQIEVEIQPSYDEVELRYEKALKMMEKFGYKFCLGLGKYNQGIQNPIEVIKTSNSFGVIEISSLDFTNLLPQNIVFRMTLFQQQPINIYQIQLQQRILMNISKMKLRLSQDNMVSSRKFMLSYSKRIGGRYASEKFSLNMLCMNQGNKNSNEEAMAAFLAENYNVFVGRIMTCRFYLNENFNDGLYDGEL